MKINNIEVLVVGVLLFVAAFMGLQRVDTYLKMNAIDECGKVARYEFTDTTSRTTTPVTDVYKKCLQDKGITVK